MASAVKAGEAFVRVYSDDTPLKRGLKGIGAQMTSLGSSVTRVGAGFAAVGAGIGAIGASILGPIGAATKAFITAGDELEKMSARTGFSVESLSELGYAAEQSGTDIKALETSVQRMQRAIVDAGDGSKTMLDTFAELGLSVSRLQSLKPDQQFKAIAAAIAKIEDPTERAARAMQVFGKSGTKLLPLITSDMQALTDEAKQLGITLTTDDAKAAAKLGDSFDRLGKTIKGAFIQIGAAVAPVLNKAVDGVVAVTSATTHWMRANRGVVVGIGAIGLGLVALGGVVTTVGAGIIGIGLAIAAVGSVATFLTGPLWGSAMAAVLPFVPVIAGITAGVLLLGAGFVYVAHKAGVLGPSFKFIQNSFGRMFDTAKMTLGGITNALKSGDWGKAAAIGWAGVKLATLQGGQQFLRAFDFIFNNAKTIQDHFVLTLIKQVGKAFAALPGVAISALRGGAGFTEAIAGVFSSVKLDLASNLDGSIARAQQNLDRLNMEAAAGAAKAAAGQQQAQQPQGINAAGAGLQQQFRQLQAAQRLAQQLPQQMRFQGQPQFNQGQQRPAFAQLPQPLPVAAGVNRSAQIPVQQLPGGGDALVPLLIVAERQLMALRRLVELGGLE